MTAGPVIKLCAGVGRLGTVKDERLWASSRITCGRRAGDNEGRVQLQQ
jgi:hypothetical protein